MHAPARSGAPVVAARFGHRAPRCKGEPAPKPPLNNFNNPIEVPIDSNLFQIPVWRKLSKALIGDPAAGIEAERVSAPKQKAGSVTVCSITIECSAVEYVGGSSRAVTEDDVMGETINE